MIKAAFYFTFFTKSAEFVTNEQTMNQVGLDVHEALHKYDGEFYKVLLNVITVVSLKSYKFINDLYNKEAIKFEGVNPFIDEWLSTAFMGCLSKPAIRLMHDTLLLNNYDSKLCAGDH